MLVEHGVGDCDGNDLSKMTFCDIGLTSIAFDFGDLRSARPLLRLSVGIFDEKRAVTALLGIVYFLLCRKEIHNEQV